MPISMRNALPVDCTGLLLLSLMFKTHIICDGHTRLESDRVLLDWLGSCGTDKNEECLICGIALGWLCYDTNEPVLKQAFEQHGEIIEVKVICDHKSGQSKGYGFVKFTSETAASKALKEMDGQAYSIKKETILQIYVQESAIGELSVATHPLLLGFDIYPAEESNEITALCRNFLWSGQATTNGTPLATANGTPLVPWDFICRSKQEGGIGITDCSASVLDESTVAKFY
ncbi:putative wall-associated receptor kinase-like 2-like [Capsicum annuum]|nr:putative wall-associated receptor kinase-like 2-like [Capsicum annuum]